MFKSKPEKIYVALVLSFTLTIILFVLSLFFNAYYIDAEETNGQPGISALLLGFFAIAGSGISWLANPCLVISLVFLKRQNIVRSKIFAVIAVLFGLSFLLFHKVLVNEGGGKSTVTAYGLGYWFWLSSLIFNLITILITEKIIKKTFADSGLAGLRP